MGENLTDDADFSLVTTAKLVELLEERFDHTLICFEMDPPIKENKNKKAKVVREFHVAGGCSAAIGLAERAIKLMLSDKFGEPEEDDDG